MEEEFSLEHDGVDTRRHYFGALGMVEDDDPFEMNGRLAERVYRTSTLGTVYLPLINVSSP